MVRDEMGRSARVGGEEVSTVGGGDACSLRTNESRGPHRAASLYPPGQRSQAWTLILPRLRVPGGVLGGWMSSSDRARSPRESGGRVRRGAAAGCNSPPGSGRGSFSSPCEFHTACPLMSSVFMVAQKLSILAWPSQLPPGSCSPPRRGSAVVPGTPRWRTGCRGPNGGATRARAVASGWRARRHGQPGRWASCQPPPGPRSGGCTQPARPPRRSQPSLVATQVMSACRTSRGPGGRLHPLGPGGWARWDQGGGCRWGGAESVASAGHAGPPDA